MIHFVKGWLKLGLTVAVRGPQASDELAWGGT